VGEGYASVTPLKVDLTRHDVLPQMKEWLST
jgi:broad specificity polyphosphatase/5'/3'-nucleotidase SurE